ncbi:MAG: 4-hydroxy-3-methylbut-2-enyl diphosphate reductase [Melioribacteraceae bacterium]|nr:4-hydroxy-3-methylbut-2-enyl diphosphate reductase [Melioribacteraceae bacterium]MCF8263454.1 4-hydroxy-3-methylbut-2-enyl diphosphate reductase [Melioribacteraceae bacterium]MCF8414074.1 4-hydroxy-3-methylbut-2-enyl diphosphate reductase [Melioribacteraceae bacterium]MCF8431001.1 4-hydroxy-3-methylbut-2-enyl diphosphate reductase [Melioribacteraceae bacterium]
MRKFEIPDKYRSSIISRLKEIRKTNDPRKQDYSPSILNFGKVKFYIARHFGFCFGVENAIEIAYKTVDENPGKRIFLISEMIHNPAVNEDLLSKGIQFIMDTEGNKYIEWDDINSDDIVIVPAFGTTLEIEKIIKEKGIDTAKYDTTCPFVEKVWNRADQLGKKDYSVVIHGKHVHEETRATFSHSIRNAPSVIVKNIDETKILAKFITGELPPEDFYSLFSGKHSEGFDVKNDLKRIGVVNQTTMLASETQEIADYLKEIMKTKFGEAEYKNHFADTRDTLCYATNDNQQATYGLLEQNADLAIVVGGYNSSNTSHIVELLEQKFPTYFISSASKIDSKNAISHFDIHRKNECLSQSFLPESDEIGIVLTSGASCPDSVVDDVLNKIISFFDIEIKPEILLEEFESRNE